MTTRTRIIVRHPEALNTILDMALARSKRTPSMALNITRYATELAISIGALEVVENEKAETVGAVPAHCAS
jgi:hypothetical protein